MTSRKRKNFTPEETTEIIRRYQGGESMAAIAKDFSASNQPIRRVLRDNEIPTRTNGEHNRAIVKNGKKLCSICTHWKLLTDYYKSKSSHTGVRHACKPCMQAKWHADWELHISKKFGITIDDYRLMLSNQNNLCAICHRPEERLLCEGVPQRLSVDHCHKTGVVRGLLCNQCNSMLGMARDSVDILKSGIKYLERITDENATRAGTRSIGCSVSV